MKTRLMLLLCAGLLCFGCSNSPTQIAGGGGGTDFPNSFALLGKNLDTNISNANAWGDSVALAYALPAPTGGAPVGAPATPPSAGSAKVMDAAASASASGLTYDYGDTSRGVVRVFYAPISDTVTEKDTISVFYDAAFRAGTWHIHSYKGEKVSQVSGIAQRYAYTDADGDSVINNATGTNRIFIAWNSRKGSGPTFFANLEVDGGADNNLQTPADNRILASKTGKISATSDTVALVTMTGYSRGHSAANQAIFDPSSRDSCFIRIRSVDNPLIGKQTITDAILVAFPFDSARSYAVYLSAIASGAARVTGSRVRRPGADSLYFAGDTVVAERVVDSSLSRLDDTLRFTFIKGPDPHDNSGNRLVELYKHISIPHAGGAIERERIFRLSFDAGLSPKDIPSSGAIFYRSVHGNGYWLQLDGNITAGEISGTYQDSDKHQGKAGWDRKGNAE